MSAPRITIQLGAFLACLSIITTTSAQATWLTEDQYTAIQSAFLQEQFERVVELSEPLFAEPSANVLTALQIPAHASQVTRVWVWYVLSLDRLHRTNDALRELDHLKISLSNLSAETATKIGADSLWPEILFWEGDISRKAFKMVRARLAYEQLLQNFPNSSWRLQATLGLGLVSFHQQAYEVARQRVHEVAQAAATASIGREALMVEGLCAVKLQRFDEALAVFRQLLEQSLESPLRTQVMFYLGEALTGLGRVDEAIPAYQQVIDADPESPWARFAYFGIGWNAFQQHRCRESLQAFARYEAAPLDASRADLRENDEQIRAELWFAQGRCLMEVGDATAALARFETLRRQQPEHPLMVEAAASMVELLERQQRFAEAASILEALFQRSLDSAQLHQTHLRLASVYLAQGEAQKALEHFRVAAESEDTALRQAALNGLGDAEAFLNNEDAATRWYEQAVGLAPTSHAGLYATYQLGRLKVQAGKMPEAIERFQWLTALTDSANPATRLLIADTRLALAFAYLSSAQPEAARAELERVRAHDAQTPESDRAEYYLALLALDEGRVEEAIQRCEEVIHRVPQSDEALEARVLLADLAASRGSSQQALATLTDAFASFRGLSPRHRGTLAKKVGDIAHQTGAYAQAIQWYEVAWQDLPAQRGELDYRLASCYEEGGDVAVALQRYRAISQAPWNIRGQLAAAKLMEREDRWQEAMTIYEFVTQQPVPEAKMAQERLAFLERTRPQTYPVRAR